jgi:hypothetical protein
LALICDSYPHNRLRLHAELCDAENPTLSREVGTHIAVKLSALRSGRIVQPKNVSCYSFLLQTKYLVLVCVRGMYVICIFVCCLVVVTLLPVKTQFGVGNKSLKPRSMCAWKD